MDLHDVLKNGYSKHEKGNINGYELDKELSNGNQQVYFNKEKNKLHYKVNGTRNLGDWITDAIALTGNLKNTSRYKQADITLKKAKDKYKINNASISAHSLGGAITSLISKKDDKVYTLDKYGLGNKIKSNEQAFRTSGDIVSILNSNSKNMKTINNGGLNFIANHNVDKIKNKKIFI